MQQQYGLCEDADGSLARPGSGDEHNHSGTNPRPFCIDPARPENRPRVGSTNKTVLNGRAEVATSQVLLTQVR